METASNDINYGEFVEKIVRRSGMSITELARRIHVNRRTIYNWFCQRSLNSDILYEIGQAVGHDFSIDFPGLYEKEKLSALKRSRTENDESVSYWMNKYISLLEKYNQHLTVGELSENNKLDIHYNLSALKID